MRRTSLTIALLLGAGCNQLLGLDEPRGLIDAGGDGMALPSDSQGNDDGPTSDALSCYGTGLTTVCLNSEPSMPLTFTTATTINTNLDSRCHPDFSDHCTIVASTINIAASVRVTGTRALVLVAASNMDISGTLDVSSDDEAGAGAASGTALCGSPTNGTVQGTSGGGGGAGGTFSGRGGNGGIGDELTTSGTESAGGVAAQALPTLALRGGCPGTRGANGTASGSGTGGLGGAGGGAVYLIADSSIVITNTGRIDASGAGGFGGGQRSGGGGGGSGGLIGLDAPVVANVGILVANGGGGGSGGAQTSTGPRGEHGGNPTLAAQGGDYNNNNLHPGAGGDGSVGTTRSGQIGGDADDNFQDGGGGGGGGAGHIVTYPSQNLNGTVSPR